jgi:hypothetical protein
MKKVKLEEFNLASSGHGWLLELIVENQVVATQLLKQEEAPLLKNQREFRNSHPQLKGGVVNFHPVLLIARDE